MKKLIVTLNQINRIVQENFKRRLFEEAVKIEQKKDFQSVGVNGVNKPEDVKHILDLFSNEKVGMSKEVQDVIGKCSPKSSSSTATTPAKTDTKSATDTTGTTDTKSTTNTKDSSDAKNPSQVIDAITSSTTTSTKSTTSASPSSDGASKASSETADIDYAAVGKCTAFHDLIGKYQRENVFSTGFSDSRIDPNMDTISKLYNVVLGITIKTAGHDFKFDGTVDFESVGQFVIDNLEGGYYHPDMLTTGVIKDQRYASSGETMFGLDRLAGKGMAESSAGKVFWDEIDKNSGWSPPSLGKKPKWGWNHMAKELGSDLRIKALNVIKPYFEQYMKNYFPKELQDVIKNSKKLMIHFIYSVWNGPWWFQEFANDIKNYVAKNPNFTEADLAQVALDSRNNNRPNLSAAANSLMQQGGKTFQKIFASIT